MYNCVGPSYTNLKLFYKREKKLLQFVKQATKIKYFIDVSKKRKTNVTGIWVIKYASNLRTEKIGGLGKFLLDKGAGNPDKAATAVTEELDGYYKGGYSLQYDTPPNKYMVDWDIKKILINHVGITSWDELDESTKKMCFKDYPKKTLPGWDDIEEERW